MVVASEDNATHILHMSNESHNRKEVASLQSHSLENRPEIKLCQESGLRNYDKK